ncbi:hypothetical protein PHYNN_58 [Pantoea phage Phynn]|nr:hypothetical protein PHYNN_58 [Pantoea phage Phynn]
MNIHEAMEVAKAGHKVTTAGGKVEGKPFFVYYQEGLGYRRATMKKYFTIYEDFIPGVYEKMSPWVIYKKDPLSGIKNAFKRVFGGKLQLNFSSNPS